MCTLCVRLLYLHTGDLTSISTLINMGGLLLLLEEKGEKEDVYLWPSLEQYCLQ